MISVVIPTKDGGADLVRCLEGIRRQIVADDVEIVVIDSGSSDDSVAIARAHGAVVHQIAPETFGHGRTRNLGVSLAGGDLLVFTSQDAVPVGDAWLATLAHAARAGGGVAGAYGRQLAHADARPPEHFFLEFLYGPRARTQELLAGAEPTFEATLFSNANSAIPRVILAEHPFGDDVAMSEDQEWSRRVLSAGYRLTYEPRAEVRHSHAYTIRTAFHRFYDSGASASRSYAPGRAGKATVRKAAQRYAREELLWLWRTGQRRWIPYAVVYELSKFVGLQLGLRRGRNNVERHQPPAPSR
jgi:rhamnosyltransferase